MKTTGIVKQIDNLNRIGIPKDILEAVNFSKYDNIEFSIDGNSLILKRVPDTCVFCDCAENLTEFGGTYICTECVSKIKQM